MLVPALDLVTDAAGKISDPGQRRVTSALWLPILKSVVREVASRKVPLLEQRVTFDITTDDRYPYPDDMVAVTTIAYTADNTNPDSYVDLGEKDRDWLRNLTQGQYQVGDPLNWVPLPSWFHIYP